MTRLIHLTASGRLVEPDRSRRREGAGGSGGCYGIRLLTSAATTSPADLPRLHTLSVFPRRFCSNQIFLHAPARPLSCDFSWSRHRQPGGVGLQWIEHL